MTDPRALAAQTLKDILSRGNSLSDAEKHLLQAKLSDRDRGFARAMVYETLRWLPRLEIILSKLLEKPLKQRDVDIQSLLLIGLCQIEYLQTPSHAAVSATADAARSLNKKWAVGLINAILRRYSRERMELTEDCEDGWIFTHAHPAWLLESFKSDWAKLWPAIATANNQQAPMCLRVNLSRISRSNYQQHLSKQGIGSDADLLSESSLILHEPQDVFQLYGFTEGLVSVQDSSAQLAAALLNPQAGDRVLDACAAPGGKTAHLLEYQSEINYLLALDKDRQRLQRVEENLQRLSLNAELKTTDAANTSNWWDGNHFDKILVDAPCSGTGVIRRHPDIKILRRPNDIMQLVQQQKRLLEALWPCLKPGGRLLYVTCSVIKQENNKQIEAFLALHEDAQSEPIQADWGLDCKTGRQILPQLSTGADKPSQDGFFYASITKTD